MENNNLSNFGRGSFKKHFCKVVLKSGYWPRRCCLKVFYFTSGGHFVQRVYVCVCVEGWGGGVHGTI